MSDVGRRLRRRYPSWFRYAARGDRHATPASDFQARVHPSSDGTTDAPIDDRTDRLFRRIALVAAIAGAILVALALFAR